MRADVSTLGFAADPHGAAAPPVPVDPYEALAAAPPGDHLVLAWLPGVAGGARALATARALVGRRDLVVIVVEAPRGADEVPLTCAVAVVAVLRRAPQDVPLAVLGALARATARTLLSWAVVGSVAGLHRPAPSLWQHATSCLPGTRFTLDLAGGRVAPGAGAAGLVLPPTGAGASPLAWAAHSGPQGRAWAEPLLAQLGVRAHDASACGAPVGGSRSRAEVSLLVVPPAQLLTTPHLLDLQPCRGCSRTTPAGSCAFCGQHRPATAHTQEHSA